MHRHALIRTALLALAAIAPALAAPAFAAPTSIAGLYALPEGQPKVSATLALTPGPQGAPPTERMLDVAMTRLGANQPIHHYETELSKQLHLIAVSDDLRTFMHEHAERPDPTGHFRVPMTFPKPGGWHIYADAVPDKLGQQVMRFDINVGTAKAAPPPAPPPPTGLTGADGSYKATFEALDLHAGHESQLALQILHDGKPATDLTPFLGVAAHAVFIDAADLTYVHVHAAPTATPEAGSAGAAPNHDMTGMPQGGADDHDGMPGMARPLDPGTAIPPDLTMHVQAPKAGTYLLWIQFMATGQVRTIPFVVAVK